MTGVTRTDARDAPSAGEPADLVIDLSVLGALVGAVDEDSVAFVEELLATWSTETDRYLAALGTAVVAGDRAWLGRVVHTLKGSSATVGAVALVVTCEQVEAQLRSGSGDLGAACDRLRAGAGETRAAFAARDRER